MAPALSGRHADPLYDWIKEKITTAPLPMRRCCFGKENVYGRGGVLGFRVVEHACRRRTLRFLCGVALFGSSDTRVQIPYPTISLRCCVIRVVEGADPYDSSNALQSKSRQAFPTPFTIHYSPFTAFTSSAALGYSGRRGRRPLQFLCGVGFSALRYNKSRRP